MQKENTSKTWKRFVDELETASNKVDIDFYEPLDWIKSSIEKIEEKEFSSYIITGPMPEPNTLNQKIDVNILVGKMVYGFSIYANRKTFFCSPLIGIIQYTEETENGFIKATLHYGSLGAGFFLMDSEANSAKLREFANKILDLAWGSR